MGWTSTYRGRGISNEDYFSEGLGPGRRILACATIRQVFYAAVEDEDRGEVWALVVLMRWNPRSSMNFTYKELDETCGPNEAHAPAKILDALTETTNTYALGWRERCRANLAAKAARPRVRAGQMVRFERPIEFTNGDRCSALVLVERNIMRDPLTDTRYRVSGWRERAYTLVDPADEI